MSHSAEYSLKRMIRKRDIALTVAGMVMIKKILPSNRKLPKRKNDSFGWKEKTEGEQIMESMME